MSTNLYHTCDIPLERYIRLVVDQDRSALIIDPDVQPAPTEEDLQAAMIDINSELADLTGSQESSSLHENLIRMFQLQERVAWIRLAVDYARDVPTIKIIDCLRGLDFGLDLDRSDPEQFTRDLDRILIEIKMDEIEIQQLVALIDQKAEEVGDQQRCTVTRQYFDDMLLAFEDMMKVQYDVSALTLRKYAGLLRRLTQKIKSERRHGQR